ncbi:MAG: TIGR04282 family arsenosugar biosynthesis glycosyltransferase, partial [Chitinophagaceae bacterium]|nr:TIGR04282 family arsenosugar biosynthesis glycosyltransferase [Chitinophagaceae bacterium]
KALSIYQSLLKHTVQITEQVPCNLYVFYADGISSNDVWPDDIYLKRNQTGEDLGARMYHAFDTLFQESYEQVLIIGTDCFELTADTIQIAFTALHNHQVVIGPSADGGYYLLGMRQFFPFLFEGIAWSTDAVYNKTIQQLALHKISYHTLPILNDIDTEDDWNQHYSKVIDS